MRWTVADVMTREVVTVGLDASFKTCVDLMRIHQISGLPVLMGRQLAGIVSESDLMRVAAAAPDEPGAPVERTGVAPPVATDLMTREVITIRADATIAAAARTMLDRHVKRLPVVDSTNRLIGIVSRGDVLRVFLRSDESIRKDVAQGLLDELPLLGRGRIDVEVRDGVVHLFGQLESGSLAGLLVRLVAAVPGVVGVEDHVRRAVLSGQLDPNKGDGSG